MLMLVKVTLWNMMQFSHTGMIMNTMGKIDHTTIQRMFGWMNKMKSGLISI